MKKLVAVLLTLACSLSLFAACGERTQEPPENPIKEEIIEIDVPEGEDVIRLPEPIDMPAKPTLPEVVSGTAPYVVYGGSSTDAYTVTQKGSGDAFEGADVSYPADGKTLANYNYIWFDVYNYAPDTEYTIVRFDFDDILGTEKVAVSAHYMEGYDTAPPVGIMVESLMDGSMSFAADLTHFNTIDKNYKESSTALNTQTVCRFFVYFDSNPSQAPSDAAGALTVSSIRFLKPDDPDAVVDNSPKISSVQANGDGYTLKTASTDGEYTGVFRADYTPNAVSAEAYVGAQVDRFTGGYGRIRLTYNSSNVGKLTVTDGTNVLSGNNEETGEAVTLDGALAAASGSIIIDIRGWSQLDELRFYIDSKGGAGSSADAAYFEVTALELIYTPYATAEWDATSKFHLSEAALGGKVKGTYSQDVGYDYMHVAVRYWTPEYSQMIVKFKTSGTAGAGAERYGVSVNSNVVLLEVAYNKVSDLPYDEATGEYTMTVDLSKLSKLATLNFYFDSINISPFGGTKTVEFTSIEFTQADPSLTYGPVVGYTDISVTNNDDGSADVSWAADKQDSFVGLPVSNLTEDYTGFTVTVQNTGNEPVMFGVFANWSAAWMAHVEIPVGETKTFNMPITSIDLEGGSVMLFLNYAVQKAGSVKISSISFLKDVTVGSMYDVATAVAAPEGAEYTVTTQDGSSVVTWEDGRSQYAKTGVNVSGWQPAYKYLKVSFTLSRDMKVGVWRHMNMNDPTGETWLTHTDYKQGENTVYIEIPEKDLTNEELNSFILFFYFDAVADVKAGEATVTEISFVTEKPAA